MAKLVAGTIAEFIGAGALTLVGAAAIMHGQPLLGVALAHGLVLGVAITASMHISGGQLNPAVSFALGVIGRQPWPRTVVFIIAQCAGAAAAAFLLSAIPPSAFAAGAEAAEKARLGATLGSISEGTGANLPLLFGLETLATFMLMYTILGAAVDQRGVGKVGSVSGLAIGLTLTAMIMCIGPLTGASLNPSRSFGPALVGDLWTAHWVYWAAPLLGATIAALLWDRALGGRTGSPK